MLLYRKQPFNYFGLNPTELTAEQAAHDPIILLHGAGGNETSCLAMAEDFEENYDGPVFTVNLVNGSWSEKDRETLEQKLVEIKQLYRLHGIYDVKTHLVGHSRGGTVGYFFSLQQDQWRVSEAEDFLGLTDATRYYTELKYREDVGHVVSIGVILPKFHSYANIRKKLHSIVSTKDQYTSEEHRSFADKDANSVLVQDLTHCELVLDKGVFSQALSWIKTPERPADIELKAEEVEGCHLQ